MVSSSWSQARMQNRVKILHIEGCHGLWIVKLISLLIICRFTYCLRCTESNKILNAKLCYHFSGKNKLSHHWICNVKNPNHRCIIIYFCQATWYLHDSCSFCFLARKDSELIGFEARGLDDSSIAVEKKTVTKRIWKSLPFFSFLVFFRVPGQWSIVRNGLLYWSCSHMANGSWNHTES